MIEVQNAFDKFLDYCRFQKNLSAKTLKAYEIDSRQFILYLGNKSGLEVKAVEAIDRELLKDYLKNLCERYKIKSVKRKIACLKAFFNYLEFEDFILVNPFRKIKISLKEPFNLPRVMTLSEVEKIFQKVYTEMGEIPNKNSYRYKAHIRDIAVIEMLFATGLRVSELCGLKKDQVDSNITFIKVRGKGNKERILFIGNDDVRAAVKKYKDLFDDDLTDSEHFFVNRLKSRLSEQSVRFMIRKYSKACDFDKKITPHTFRHSFATLLLEEGVDIKYIQSFLGHSSITTTQIYTHVNQDKQREILTCKHPRRNLKAF